MRNVKPKEPQLSCATQELLDLHGYLRIDGRDRITRLAKKGA
jgi:hypothetical protein